MSEKVEQLADSISKMDKQAAGMLGEALMRALGIKVVYYTVPAKPAEPVVEQTEFSVVLEGFDPLKKVNVIREVRAITGLGLVESKNFVEAAPKAIKEELSKYDAEKIRDALVAAGATAKVV